MSAALEIIEARISSEDQKHVVDLTNEDILGQHESTFGVDYVLDTLKLKVHVAFYDNGPADSHDAYALVDDHAVTFVVDDNARALQLSAFGSLKKFDIYATYKKLLVVIDEYEKLRAQFKRRSEIKVNGLVFKLQTDTESGGALYQLTGIPAHVEAKIVIKFNPDNSNLYSVRVVIANGSRDDLNITVHCRENHLDYFNFNQKLSAILQRFKRQINSVLSSIDAPLEIKLDMGALHKHATVEKDIAPVMHDIEKLLSNHGITLEVQRHG